MKKNQKIKRLISSIFWAFLLGILILTRITNIGWGLPLPMHPDERNMAVALQNLYCPPFELSTILNFNHFLLWLKNCYNPHFYAYGQLPLYLSLILLNLIHFIVKHPDLTLTYTEAVLSLRTISLLTNILNFYFLIKIVRLFHPQKNWRFLLSLSTFVFVPFFIQYAHFGTTESLLMFFYTVIVYLCLKIMLDRSLSKKNVFFLGLLSGLSLGTKISSLIFLIPVLITFSLKHKTWREKFISQLMVLIYALLFFFISSPHNFLNLAEFLSSINYETAVATGRIKVFYTYQFQNSLPIIFQFFKIFPYSLGWPLFILSLFGFIFTSWKDKKNLILKISIISYFLINAFLYVKWTRFLAPIFPLMLVLSVIFLIKIKSNFLYLLILFISILPGMAFFSIYRNDDIRIISSQWIFKHLENNAFILSETANVVDIPFTIDETRGKKFNYLSFNFYDLDNNYALQANLDQYLKKADYIIVPSRRIISNYTCFLNKNDLSYNKKRCQEISKKYPLLQNYYQNLLYSGKYQLIKTFSNFPKIEIFGKTLLEFPDEKAEETWTVFDHPVIRIYKKVDKKL